MSNVVDILTRESVSAGPLVKEAVGAVSIRGDLDVDRVLAPYRPGGQRAKLKTVGKLPTRRGTATVRHGGNRVQVVPGFSGQKPGLRILKAAECGPTWGKETTANVMPLVTGAVKMFGVRGAAKAGLGLAKNMAPSVLRRGAASALGKVRKLTQGNAGTGATPLTTPS